MENKMKWENLVNDKRFGLESYHDPHKSLIRTDFRRDYDRLVFSSPFRRLQNKTQVFPLPGSIFVHNRLTHSLEVACVGKSMADQIACGLRQKYASEPFKDCFDHLGDIVAAACLAHDLGNPPFGHSGERAIAAFFSEGDGKSLQSELSDIQWTDITRFEGNANAFRVLTHQFNGRRKGGFAMTYSTLASVVKYPFDSLETDKKKFGFFSTETEYFKGVADELGMISLPATTGKVRYARHPLVFIVEAADDICYEVMDMEDAHKLKILPTAEVIDALMAFFDNEKQAHIYDIMSHVDDPNEKIAYMRSCVIGKLVNDCAQAFLDREEDILAGKLSDPLIDITPEITRSGYEECTKISWSKIYRSSDVVDIEIAGNRIITFLLENFIDAVCNPQMSFSKLLLSKFPEQYDVASPTLFGRLQAVLDHISAMTDVYALDLYRKLNGYNLRIEN